MEDRVKLEAEFIDELRELILLELILQDTAVREFNRINNLGTQYGSTKRKPVLEN